MKLQLDQRRALNRLRFDVFDAGDVEEMVLVIIDQKPFHLRRVHAAIGLSDINHRDAEVGEYVARHPLNGEKAREHRSMTSTKAITRTRIVMGRRSAKETRFIRLVS